jgi:hypothetical protein
VTPPPQLSGKFSFDKTKEFWYSFLCHVLATVASEAFGNISIIRGLAWILFFTGTFFLGKFLYHYQIPKWAWICVILLYTLGSTTALAEFGYLPVFQLQGRLHGAELGPEGLETIVLLVEDSQKPLAKQYASIDKDGRFHFSGLKRGRYELEVYRHKGNLVELEEFIVDLSDESVWDRAVSFNGNFSPETFTVKAKRNCYFDSGISKLDSDATDTI